MRSLLSVLSLCLGQVDTKTKDSFSFRARADREHCQCIERSKFKPKLEPELCLTGSVLEERSTPGGLQVGSRIPKLNTQPRRRRLDSSPPPNSANNQHARREEGKFGGGQWLNTRWIHFSGLGITRASRFFFRWISADRADQFLPR